MLKINHLYKNYKDFTLDCSLEVAKGHITGLIGQNGAGKSTTFKAILGLIDVNNEAITLFDQPIEKAYPDSKQKLGVVLSDSGFSSYFKISDLIPILNHVYSEFDIDYFKAQIQHFKIPTNKPIKTFSTGTKAKLKLIIALSHQAKMLILDEPTSGLDVIARDECLELLKSYMEENEERSILISSHISSDLESLCDDIYMIHDGKIILHEDTDILLSDYATIKCSEQEFDSLDKNYLLKIKKENYGYCCLTNQKMYYVENFPSLVIQNNSLDDTITMMIRGNEL